MKATGPKCPKLPIGTRVRVFWGIAGWLPGVVTGYSDTGKSHRIGIDRTHRLGGRRRTTIRIGARTVVRELSLLTAFPP